jgi:hypothetical protein
MFQADLLLQSLLFTMDVKPIIIASSLVFDYLRHIIETRFVCSEQGDSQVDIGPFVQWWDQNTEQWATLDAHEKVKQLLTQVGPVSTHSPPFQSRSSLHLPFFVHGFVLINARASCGSTS